MPTALWKESAQYNGCKLSGPNPQNAVLVSWCFEGCRKMAVTLNDIEFAGKCAKIYQSGSKWTDKNLFNGEYYEHMVLDPKNQRG
jgi:non-lysosomal glucosylceramidase